MGEKKRGISMRRRTDRGPANGSNSPSPIDPDGQPSAPRFSPSRKSVTTGGAVYGALIANERAKLGLTQMELAAKAGTSHSTIARIEQGHPPRPEIRKQLSVALNAAPSSALHFPIVRKAQRGLRKPAKPPRGPRKERPDLGRSVRDRGKAVRDRGMTLLERQKELRDRRKAPLDQPKATRRAPRERTLRARARRERPRRPRVSLGLRWIWGSLALPLVAILAVIAAGSITGSDPTNGASLASTRVSNAIGAPATIHKARVAAQKRAAAEARRAAERRREREAAAAAAAASAASKAAPKEQRQNSAPIAPVTPTVSPSPPPSSGGGGGGSSGRAPDLQHGIGSGGGSAPSGSGSSPTPSDNSPKSASSGGGSTAPSRPTCRLLVLC
jgi:transcriptional regulator with XRE-family HTH domain